MNAVELIHKQTLGRTKTPWPQHGLALMSTAMLEVTQSLINLWSCHVLCRKKDLDGRLLTGTCDVIILSIILSILSILSIILSHLKLLVFDGVPVQLPLHLAAAECLATFQASCPKRN